MAFIVSLYPCSVDMSAVQFLKCSSYSYLFSFDQWDQCKFPTWTYNWAIKDNNNYPNTTFFNRKVWVIVVKSAVQHLSAYCFGFIAQNATVCLCFQQNEARKTLISLFSLVILQHVVLLKLTKVLTATYVVNVNHLYNPIYRTQLCCFFATPELSKQWFRVWYRLKKLWHLARTKKKNYAQKTFSVSVGRSVVHQFMETESMYHIIWDEDQLLTTG